MSKDVFWNRSEWVNSGVWVRVGIVEQGARRAGELRGGERGEFRRLELRQMI